MKNSLLFISLLVFLCFEGIAQTGPDDEKWYIYYKGTNSCHSNTPILTGTITPRAITSYAIRIIYTPPILTPFPKEGAITLNGILDELGLDILISNGTYTFEHYGKIAFQAGRSAYNLKYSNTAPDYALVVNADYDFTVDDPLRIESATFESGNKYSCSNTPENIKIKTRTCINNGKTPGPQLQVQDERGRWQTINLTLNPGGGETIIVGYDKFKNYIVDGQPIRFRTKKLLNNNTYSYSYVIEDNLPRYLSKFEGNITYTPPVCAEESFEIEIDGTDGDHFNIELIDGLQHYNFTTHDIWDSSRGKYIVKNGIRNANPSCTENCYLNLETGKNYTFIFEAVEAEPENISCPLIKRLSIPKVDTFKFSAGFETTGTDNTGKEYQYGACSLNIENSTTEYVDLYKAPGIRIHENFRLAGSAGNYGGTYILTNPAHLTTTGNNFYFTNGDCITKERFVQLVYPEAIEFEIRPKDAVSCNHQCLPGSGTFNNGTLTVDAVDGGKGDFTVSVLEIDPDGSTRNVTPVNNSVKYQESLDIGNLEAKLHRITLTDALGASRTEEFEVPEKALPVFTIENQESPSMACQPDGTLTLGTPVGGTQPYTYSRTGTGFNASPIITGYSGGSQYVYISDFNACISMYPVEFEVIPKIKLSDPGIPPSAPVCYGTPTGRFECTVDNMFDSVIVSSISPAYPAARIVESADRIVFSRLYAGDYNITLQNYRDGKTCSLDTFFSIPGKPRIKLDSVVTPVSGKGTATGSVKLIVSGGMPGERIYNLYNESDELDTSITSTSNPEGLDTVSFFHLEGSDAGNGKAYFVDIIDPSGCSYEAEWGAKYSFYVPEPQNTLVLDATVYPVSCYGYADGAVSLKARGGWDERYEYSTDKNFGDTASFFSGIAFGCRTFYVQDLHGGIDSAEVCFNQPDSLQAVLSGKQDALCYGTETGWLRFSMRGGTMPYSVAGLNDSVQVLAADTLLWVYQLDSGNYTFRIQDDRGCQTAVSHTHSIIHPPPLTITECIPEHTTCELDNGAILARTNGGTGPYTYRWIGNTTGYDKSITGLKEDSTCVISNLEPDIYRLTVTDLNQCTDNVNQVVLDYVNPSIKNRNLTDVRCHEEGNGEIEIIAQRGTEGVAYYTLLAGSRTYSDTNTTGLFTTLEPDSYHPFVFDSLGCRSDSVPPYGIIQPDSLYVKIDSVCPAIQKDAATGQISFSPYGGNPGVKNISLLASDGQAISNLSGINNYSGEFTRVNAGTYSLYITDTKNCDFTSESFTVTEPDTALGFEVTDNNDSRCKARTGSITVEAFGGWGGYEYELGTDSGFYDFNTFSRLSPGTYQLTVRDRYRAEYSEFITIHEPRDSLKAVVTGMEPPTCGPNGRLHIDISGGKAPYTLAFDNESPGTFSSPQTVTYTNRPAGKSVLHVTDSNGCPFFLETDLPENRLLKMEALNLTCPTARGTADGAIEALANGGIAPLGYAWKERYGSPLPETGPLLGNIPSGHYTLTISEQGGCSVSEHISLEALLDDALVLLEKEDETAYQAQNGYVVLKTSLDSLTRVEWIDASGIRTFFDADESNAVFHVRGDTLFFNNLAGGEYYAAAHNIRGQKEYRAFNILPYRRFYISGRNITAVSRPGAADGGINITVSGGGGDNAFQWINLAMPGMPLNSSHNAGGSLLRDVPAGGYRFTATDRYGHTLTDTLAVTEPESALTISLSDYRNEKCKDDENAWVSLQSSGGWGNHLFRHESDTYYEADSLFRNLSVKTHTFYLRDETGTEDSLTLTITEPEYLTARIALTDSVDCKDARDGNFFFDIQGGTPPYCHTFVSDPEIWDWDWDTVARNLPAGEYAFLFSDTNGCTGQDTLKLKMPEPDSLLFTVFDITHTTCDTDNGTITAALQGGTRPYRYRWYYGTDQTAGTDSVITNLMQSTGYTLEVLDLHNCRQDSSLFIRPSAVPYITDIDTVPSLCSYDSTGRAWIAEVQPGVPFAPFRFEWSNADTGYSSSGYPDGLYSVAVVDSNGCTTTKSFEITSPDPLGITVTDYKDDHCYGYNDGFIEIMPSGGVGDYRYLWTNGDTAARADSLFTGYHLLQLTDSNQCLFTREFEIQQPDEVIVDLGEDITICPGSTKTLDGQDFPAHRWADSQGVFSDERFVTLEAVNPCYLRVTDSTGCFGYDTITIVTGEDALRSDFLMTSEAFTGDTLTLFELSNMELDSMSWEFVPESFTDITDNAAPDYVLHLKTLGTGIFNVGLRAYSGGCISETFKQVEIYAANDSVDRYDFTGYKEPLIESFTVAPNPTDGTFTLRIGLREETDIKLIVYNINYGRKEDERTARGMKDYELDYALTGLNTGMYLIFLDADNERKQIKIIIE